MLEKVFIVVRKIAYEGDTIIRVFAKYDDAVKYADELTAEDANLEDFIVYDVCERELY